MTIAIGVWAATGGRAAAQPMPRVEVSGGFIFLSFNDATAVREWYAEVAVPIDTWFDIVGEISGSSETHTVQAQQLTRGAIGGTVVRGTVHASVDTTLYTFLTGGRFGSPDRSRIRAFGQFVIGAGRLASAADITLTGMPTEDFVAAVRNRHTNTSIRFVMQSGGGFNVAAGRGIGAHVAIDYVRLFAGETMGVSQGDRSGLRATAGIVWSVGSR